MMVPNQQTLLFKYINIAFLLTHFVAITSQAKQIEGDWAVRGRRDVKNFIKT